MYNLTPPPRRIKVNIIIKSQNPNKNIHFNHQHIPFE